ncbi:G-protein coupled receptors family 1 profile domain-containing protein [Plasmodiophora brassicae]
MDMEARDVGNLLCVLTFLFLLAYYSYICLRIRQYDHATNVRLAVLNIVSAVIYLLSAPLPFIKNGCEIFYNAAGTLYLGSQLLLFSNRVIFSFYQMDLNTQAVLKTIVLAILVAGSATTTAYLGMRTNLVGVMTPGEYSCYLIRNGSAQSLSGYSRIAVTVSMVVVAVGMGVVFIYAVIGIMEFKRTPTARKQHLATIHLALFSFGSSAINQAMNAMDQMNMLTGLSAARKAQEVLDSVIALTLAVMVHRNIAATRSSRIRSTESAQSRHRQQVTQVRSVTSEDAAVESIL